MRRIEATLILLAATVVPLVAQKIGTETSDRTRIVHLKTALNHLTVIEVGEPVLEVAAGSPSFKVEWRENKVFVQPMEADTATNLFIWTASQRLNYELSRGRGGGEHGLRRRPSRCTHPGADEAHGYDGPGTDFAIDYGTAARGKADSNAAFKTALLEAGGSMISDLYEKDGRLLIRYAVRNHGAQLTTSLTHRRCIKLEGVRSHQSLYGFVDSQLGDEQITKLKIKQETPVKVLDGQLQSASIAPGQEVVGVVALQMDFPPKPDGPAPAVSSVNESGDASSQGQQTQIAAFLVR